MCILIPHFPCNFTGTHGSTAKQFLRLAHTQCGQILNKCLPHVLAEQGAEMISTDIRHMSHFIQRNLFIHIILINKIHRLLQQIPVLISRILISNDNCLPQKLLTVTDRCLHRLPCLFYNIIGFLS